MVLRHVSKQIAIAQEIYTRGGQKSALSKKVKMGSIGIPSTILASPSGKICRDAVVFT